MVMTHVFGTIWYGKQSTGALHMDDLEISHQDLYFVDIKEDSKKFNNK
jgi:hypothetical protein